MKGWDPLKTISNVWGRRRDVFPSLNLISFKDQKKCCHNHTLNGIVPVSISGFYPNLIQVQVKRLGKHFPSVPFSIAEVHRGAVTSLNQSLNKTKGQGLMTSALSFFNQVRYFLFCSCIHNAVLQIQVTDQSQKTAASYRPSVTGILSHLSS